MRRAEALESLESAAVRARRVGLHPAALRVVRLPVVVDAQLDARLVDLALALDLALAARALAPRL
eukprot:8521796-Lingulodinium_polyedra.AAC.1